ncbi:hypothetical protein ACEQ8H_005654 [Pleosporales sp. CAS-2024a]
MVQTSNTLTSPQASALQADVVASQAPQPYADTTGATSAGTSLSGLYGDLGIPSPRRSQHGSSAEEFLADMTSLLNGSVAARPATPPSMEASTDSDEPAEHTRLPATPESILYDELSSTSASTRPTGAAAEPVTQRPHPSHSRKNWTDRAKVAKDAHYKRSRIFSKTRQMILHRTPNMVISATRGYQRAGYVPTKTTAPPLLKRRYSVDVITPDWHGRRRQELLEINKFEVCKHVDPRGTAAFPTSHTIACSPCLELLADNSKAKPPARCYDENEAMIENEPIQSLPNPLRYQYFNSRAATQPPYDGNTYLRLDHTLSNDYFHQMTDTQGSEAWMDDSSLNMALDVLRIHKNCKAHGIDVANSDTVQMIHIASGDSDAQDPSYNDLRERFRDKKWIMFPVNDGMGGYSAPSHWALVVMDFVHMRVFYYNSIGVERNAMYYIAFEISGALLKILGTNTERWVFLPQENSPNQFQNNMHGNDHGPCGPFVWKMMQIFIDQIIYYQVAGREIDCDLELASDFPEYFGTLFNSMNVRIEMQHSLILAKIQMDSTKAMDEHDQAAVNDEDVVLSDAPPQPFQPPVRTSEQDSETETETETISEDERDLEGGISIIGDENLCHFTSVASSSSPRETPAEDIVLGEDDETSDVQLYDSTSPVRLVRTHSHISDDDAAVQHRSANRRRRHGVNSTASS